jgi:NADH-quinone oxidoreductase subunit H
MMSESTLDQLLYMLFLVLKILAIVVPLILAVAYYTYFERKVIGYMQIRLGPNTIGPYLFQPFAGVQAAQRNCHAGKCQQFLFLLAPVKRNPAFASWAVVRSTTS